MKNQQSSVAEERAGLGRLFRVVHEKTGLDLKPYKEKYLRRRIDVRLRATGLENLTAYISLLRENEEELEALLVCLTIHVSSFFRNPSTFQAISREVLPRIFDGDPAQPVLAWSVGCARGEEPYSLAILISEYLGRDRRRRKVRIEAVDVDERVLEEAKEGVYARSRLKELDRGVAGKYFSDGDPCRLVPEIRKMVSFHRRDILMDPPQKTFDLILCRNLLIYIEREPQELIVERFHSVLRPGGFLALGRTEVLVGNMRDRFEVVDARERIYRKAS